MTNLSPEPEYEFVKGVGWNVKSYEWAETRSLDGVSIRLIMRTPQKGELYLSIPTLDKYGYRNVVTKRSFERLMWRTRYNELKPRKVKAKDEIIYCVVQRID